MNPKVPSRQWPQESIGDNHVSVIIASEYLYRGRNKFATVTKAFEKWLLTNK